MLKYILTIGLLITWVSQGHAQITFGGGGTSGGGGVSGWPTVSTTKNVTWANSFANALGIGKDTNDYWAIYHDATDGLQLICVVAGVANDCNYIRKLASGKNFQIQNSSGTSIGTLTESTGAWTNFTLDTEASGNNVTIQETRWFDAAACQNSVATLIWNQPTANFPAAVCDPDSTPNAYASFDATTDESFDFDFVLPTGFTGAIDAHFIWKAAATSGATGWCMQLVRVPDGTTSGQSHAAQSTSNCVSDTAKGTTLQENRADKTSITCTSCAAGDRVKGRISRDANGGAVTDDMTGDAHLIKFGYTIRVTK